MVAALSIGCVGLSKRGENYRQIIMLIKPIKLNLYYLGVIFIHITSSSHK